MNTRGKVPHFTLRPHPAVTGAFFFVLVIGLLISMSLLTKDEGSGGNYRQMAIFIMIVTGVICVCLAILATSKLWFTHLWKKNSNHARHKNHTKHHPAMRDKEFRNHRR